MILYINHDTIYKPRYSSCVRVRACMRAYVHAFVCVHAVACVRACVRALCTHAYLDPLCCHLPPPPLNPPSWLCKVAGDFNIQPAQPTYKVLAWVSACSRVCCAS